MPGLACETSDDESVVNAGLQYDSDSDTEDDADAYFKIANQYKELAQHVNDNPCTKQPHGADEV